MKEDYISNLPHGNDMQAVVGYAYTSTKKNVLNLWDELLSHGQISLLVGTNFDLSKHLDKCEEKKIMIQYDFLHRVMLFPFDAQNDIRFLNLTDFKKLIEFS